MVRRMLNTSKRLDMETRNTIINDFTSKLRFCISVGVKQVFSTHTYSFGGVTFLQLVRGAIGLRLTSVFAKIWMGRWLRLVRAHLLQPQVGKGVPGSVKRSQTKLAKSRKPVSQWSSRGAAGTILQKN